MVNDAFLRLEARLFLHYHFLLRFYLFDFLYFGHFRLLFDLNHFFFLWFLALQGSDKVTDATYLGLLRIESALNPRKVALDDTFEYAESKLHRQACIFLLLVVLHLLVGVLEY